jgi:CO dehydrogenase maturation factor
LSFSIAVAGKGGCGKTTLATLVVRYLKRHDLTPVLAIDADPNQNFGESLGLEVGRTVGSVIAGFNEEKIGLPQGMTKEAYLEFRLNETLVESRGLDLVTMGRGQGDDCYCYPNTVLRKFADSLLHSYRYMVMDNEAGMEHLSRRTTDNVDVLLLVANHSVKGVRAVARITELVKELKLRVGRELVVVNGVPGHLDPLLQEEMVRLHVEPAALIPEDNLIERFDFERRSLVDLPDDSPAVLAADRLVTEILSRELTANRREKE